MKVPITGGTGHIGSQTILELLLAGREVFSVDNYCNSSPESLRLVRRLANAEIGEAEVDVRDSGKLREVIADFASEVVVHIAKLNAVERHRKSR